jgi:hypothetical protein
VRQRPKPVTALRRALSSRRDFFGFRAKVFPRFAHTPCRGCGPTHYPLQIRNQNSHSGISAVARRLLRWQIKITYPRTCETLQRGESEGRGFTYPVRGTLNRLPKMNEIGFSHRTNRRKTFGRRVPYRCSTIQIQRAGKARLTGLVARTSESSLVAHPPLRRTISATFKSWEACANGGMSPCVAFHPSA